MKHYPTVSAAASTAVGSFEVDHDDKGEVQVQIGFRPRHLRIVDSAGKAVAEWFSGMLVKQEPAPANENKAAKRSKDVVDADVAVQPMVVDTYERGFLLSGEALTVGTLFYVAHA